MENLYWEDLDLCIPRLLALIDKNPFSQTAGSFSRNHWHFKTNDFPPAIHQIGLAVLAKLYTNNRLRNISRKELIRLLSNGVHYTAKLQKSDGSFDEWYVNERGWAGPTGYILNALCDLYHHSSSLLDEKIQHVLLEVIKKAAYALTRTGEKHVLANHIAIAILPLAQANEFLQDPYITGKIQELWSDFLKVWHAEEGWSLEYDGADPGYQSATIAFLSKCPQPSELPGIKEVLDHSLKFISYFAYPDGSFGGHIGSRHTITLFPSGIESLTDPLSRRLSLWIKDSRLQRNLILPQDMDDHYFLYRCNEWCDAAIVSDQNKPIDRELCARLPFEKSDFTKIFPKASLCIKKSRDLYTVCSLSRGGATKIFNISAKRLLINDAGVLAVKNKKILSSLWQGQYDIQLSDQRWHVEGPLHNTTPKFFSPLRFIAFRLFFLCFGFHHKLAQHLKDLIRVMLMVHVKPEAFTFSRTIVFSDEGVKITTTSDITNAAIVTGGDFITRYVPQSGYSTKNHEHTANHFIEHQSLKEGHTYTIRHEGSV